MGPQGNGDTRVLDCRCPPPLFPSFQQLPLAAGYHSSLASMAPPLQSLDYEIVENDDLVIKDRQCTCTQNLQYTFFKWMLVSLVGLLTGLTGLAINLAIENIAGFKLLKIAQFIESRRLDVAFSILVGSNLVLVLSSALLCAYIGPAAAGSGIPEVKAYLNGIDVPDILAPRALFVKVFGSIGTVAGGLDAGRQGPLVHTGACIAALLSQGGSERHHLTWKWLHYFKNDKDRRDLVTCGAAAGIAAAFKAPLGGVLFALEEGASWWHNFLLWRVFFTTALVAVVIRTAISFCGDKNCGLYGHGGLIMYNIGNFSVKFRLLELVPVVILGLIGGFMGSLFTFFNGKIVEVYSTWHTKHGRAVKILHGVLISLITSACTIGLPWLGACTACIVEKCPTNLGSIGEFARFTCPDGQYNDLATLFFSTNDDVVRDLFSVGTNSKFEYKSLAVYLVSSYTLALVTYGTPIPSGLFLPIIMSGATYGRMLGISVKAWNKELSELDEGLYAVLGAASLLGGSLRVTMSLCVILLELTNNLLMLPLTMLVLVISKTTGDLVNQGLYDQLLRVKRLPFLQEYPQPYMKHLTALDVCSRPLVTLNAIERVKNIVEILQTTDHNAFPVLSTEASSQKTTFHGLVLRSHLLDLLKSRKLIPVSTEELAVDSVALNLSEEQTYVDLQPFTDTSTYTVVDSMSLEKAFTLFRKVGLRHLCVIPRLESGIPIIGMLTRHDFLAEHIFSKFPQLKQSKCTSPCLRFPFFKRSVIVEQLSGPSRL